MGFSSVVCTEIKVLGGWVAYQGSVLEGVALPCVDQHICYRTGKNGTARQTAVSEHGYVSKLLCHLLIVAV